MFSRKLALSSLSLLALSALAVVSGGGCTASNGPDEVAEDGAESNAGVADGFRHAVAEQIWFKAGNGFRRRVNWSSDPQYASRGGFIWGQATPFQPLPEAWWSSGLPSRTVKGFEAFTVGNNLYEQVWVVNPGNGGRTEMYMRTRDVHTDAAGGWSFALADSDIPCTTADCRVSAWSVTLSENKMIQAVWRGRTAHLRTNDVILDKASGKYSVTNYGAWGVIDATQLPYPAGQENWTRIVGQQGFELQLGSPIEGSCQGQPIYGQYVQAWSHEDGRGYARFVPVAADGNVLWKCASPTTLVQYDAADAPIGDSSTHLLYEETGAAGGSCCMLTPPGNLEKTFTACGGGGDHYGIDYTDPVGTPIPAGISGTVLSVRTAVPGQCDVYPNCSDDCFNTQFNYVKIRSDCGDPNKPGNDLIVWYMHIDHLAPGVEAGAHVDQGQIIAYSGNSGCTTGPHIHLETASVPAGQSTVSATCNSQDPAVSYCK